MLGIHWTQYISGETLFFTLHHLKTTYSCYPKSWVESLAQNIIFFAFWIDLLQWILCVKENIVSPVEETQCQNTVCEHTECQNQIPRILPVWGYWSFLDLLRFKYVFCSPYPNYPCVKSLLVQIKACVYFQATCNSFYIQTVGLSACNETTK